MTVHALHIFDRKGKTLFTKRYSAAAQQQLTEPQQVQQQQGPIGSNNNTTTTIDVNEQLSEQRKLVFGLLFSIRELVGSLGPSDENNDDNTSDTNNEQIVQPGNPIALHSVRTGASTLHNYETISGLRFAMYTDNNIKIGSTKQQQNQQQQQQWGSNNNSSHPTDMSSNSSNNAIRDALRHIYTDIWVDCVIRSPLYRHGAIPEPGSVKSSNSSDGMIGKVDIKSTLFEMKLDEYLMSMPWFK